MAAAVAMIHEMMSSRKRDKAKIACDLWEDSRKLEWKRMDDKLGKNKKN